MTGEIKRHAADAVVLASGGYGNVFYLSSTMGSNVTACRAPQAWSWARERLVYTDPSNMYPGFW